MDEIYKTCTKCNYSFPLSNYSKQRYGKYGVSSWCKQCCNQNKYQWKLRNREKVKTTNRLYGQRNKDRINARTRQWRRQNSIQYRQIIANRKIKKYQAKICIDCKEPTFLDSKQCIHHAIQQRVRLIYRKMNLSWQSTQALDLIQSLAKILQEQTHCRHSGLPFIYAKEIHLDHNLALCKRPDLALDISNLQFTHRLYNYHKRDLTDAEYLEHCQNILVRAGYNITDPNR